MEASGGVGEDSLAVGVGPTVRPGVDGERRAGSSLAPGNPRFRLPISATTNRTRTTAATTATNRATGPMDDGTDPRYHQVCGPPPGVLTRISARLRVMGT